jgi:hypothetical protein
MSRLLVQVVVLVQDLVVVQVLVPCSSTGTCTLY